MSQHKQFPNQHAPHDETNVNFTPKHIISAVWHTKWRVGIVLCLATAVFALLTLVEHHNRSQATRYNQVFDLTFEGLSDGQFPDGSPFILSNIVRPDILDRVYLSNRLQEQGLSPEDFRHAVSIEPYSPNYHQILANYQARLGNNNLSASDIVTLRERMQADLRAAQSSAVVLSLHQPPETWEISPALAENVLNDIAQFWSTLAIEERGVLRLSLPIYSQQIFDEARFDLLDYLVGVELLLDNISLIQGNVQTLKQQPNASGVSDEETGFNLEDLEKAINDVAQYDLRQLIDPIKELGLTRNAPAVRLYYSRQLQELGLDKHFWEERASLTRETLANYSDDRRSRSVPGTSDQVAQRDRSGQLGEPFLDRLVDISRQSGEQQFRQNLTAEVLSSKNQALNISQRMEDLQQTLDAIDNPVSGDLRQAYFAEIEETLPNILSTLRGYTRVIGRLHEQLGQRAAGNIRQIIAPQAESFQTLSAQLLDRNKLAELIALLMLTGIVSLFACLLYDMLKRRRSAP